MYAVMKIYFDKITGEILWGPSYNQPTIVNFDHDYEVVKELNIRTKDSIGLLVLENGQYEQDFAESNGYRVNVETKTLEFSYPDPNEPEAPPVYQKPLSEQILELKTKQIATNQAVEENSTAQQDLLELLIDMGVI